MRATLRARMRWCLPLAFLATLPAHAEDQLKKVRIAFAGPALSIAQPWLQMPGPLGYWRQEGLDVNVFVARGSLQAIQLLISGQADVVQINSWPLVQAATNNGILIRDLMLNTVIDWQLVVPQDSAIKTVRDFKGKTIGTAGLPGMAFLKSYLKANGLDPDHDVQIVPTGAGALAGQALTNKKVQGLFYRGSVIAGLENSGSVFRSFSDPEWHRLPGYSMATLQSTIARDPQMLEGLVRGAAKASLFATTNPDCVVQLQWANYPATKPAGIDDETAAKWDRRTLDLTLATMKMAFELSGGAEWGKSTREQFARLQDIFLRGRLIAKKLVNPADYTIGVPDFFQKANRFDHDAIVAQAKTCDGKSQQANTHSTN
ncbi:MAG: ABC transporter substrate-binding protein [Xanthobacteraceae bacterium]|nr:ABC transporter substrate-binding protein [Xanthobacteraceae bacterium]MBV9631343.1 ABC transporter substrate-binding protein [Xanthobacteraceae bacterium]